MADIVFVNEQGQKAMRNGRILPEALAWMFERYSYVVLPYSSYRFVSEKPALVAVKDVPFCSIYDCMSTTDFVLHNFDMNKEIRIWCKWQEVAGTVDEKFPYLVKCLDKFPEKEVVLLVDGNGWREGAKEWLKNEVARRNFRLANGVKQNVRVITLEEFVEYFLRMHGKEREVDLVKELIRSAVWKERFNTKQQIIPSFL